VCRVVKVCCRGCLSLLSKHSVAAFFNLIGEEWRQLFSEVRTREFRYVKPDKRLLLDVAQVRRSRPQRRALFCGHMYSVGPIIEDVQMLEML